MIPHKINAFFVLIDFLDKNKEEYINKYIPLCNELKELDIKRNKLNPNKNYLDKQSYDKVQTQIEKKFKPITENIYKPITDKLRELEIWSGDKEYTSIWNKNISEISEFKRNFKEEDIKQILVYKQKYLSFRRETNSEFLCLSFVFQSLDEILKELFDFFKTTKDNEFEKFEAKTIQIKDFKELAKNLSINKGQNLKYSIPSESLLYKEETLNKINNLKNEIIMGDKIEIGNISNNEGQINVGKHNKAKLNSNDKLSEKAYNWQKWGIITASILAIITILLTVIYS